MILSVSHQEFKNRLNEWNTALDEGKLITDSLEIVTRGWKFYLLGLMQPFVRMFGGDLFSHLRIHRVVEEIFKGALASVDNLKDVEYKTQLLSVMGKLNRKGGNKFDSLIDEINGVFSGNFSPCKWGDERVLREIGLSPSKKRKIEAAMSAFNCFVKRGGITFSSRRDGNGVNWISSERNGEVIFERRFVYKTVVLNGGIVALLPQVVGVGGERAVKSAYNIFTGTRFVKKSSAFVEELILRRLNSSVERFFFSGKKQYLEQMGDDILNNCWRVFKEGEPKYKVEAIRSLVDEISRVHKVIVPSLVFDNGAHRTGDFLAYHGDIHPRNILAFNPGRLALTDFGGAGNVLSLGIFSGYQPPESESFSAFLKQYTGPNKDGQLLKFNLQTGQARDMWQIGLIIANLLQKNTEGVSPLRCVNHYLQKSASELQKLTQQEVDGEINSLQQNESRQQLKQVWEVVKMMLKVDYKQRTSADSALQLLNKITF